MRHPNSQGNPAELSLANGFESALVSAGIAAWNMDVSSGVILFSPGARALIPGVTDLRISLAKLLQQVAAADRFVFFQSFNADFSDTDTHCLRSCEVHWPASNSNLRLKFVGRLVEADGANRQFQGVVLNTSHWLTQSGPIAAQEYLVDLLTDNPVPCMLTDNRGILLYTNSACEQLFLLAPRQADSALGRYSLLEDPQITRLPDVANAIERIYFSGQPGSTELYYQLGAIHNSPFVSERRLYLQVNFLPIKNSAGQVERMLVQLQDLSR